MLQDAESDPADFLRLYPDCAPALREEAPEYEKPELYPLSDNKSLTITDELRAQVLVFEIKTNEERRLPFGEAFMEFTGLPAVILHLQDFSLWITTSYTDNGIALPCINSADKEALNSNYS